MIISASLSPNSEPDDVLLALKVLLVPGNWIQGQAQKEVEDWFKKNYFGATVATFNSGRSALFALLQYFGISHGDEVIVQAFTCVAVPNAVLWVGATPIYVDLDDTYNLDFSECEKKITKKTKAIIVQHTFGLPADIEAIVALAKKNNLLVIEDCAHCLGTLYKGKMLGSYGDAAFFSFGRDKVVSSVWGGAACINEKCKIENVKLKLREIHDAIPYPSKFWIFQQLLHPIAFRLILPLYQLGIGKLLLVCLQTFKMLSFPVYPEEKNGEQPNVFPKKYPNALAVLLVRQLRKLERYQWQRCENTSVYMNKLKSSGKVVEQVKEYRLGLLRYPMTVDNPKELIEYAKTQGILLGNWYHHVIDPSGVDFVRLGYKKGSCPKAEYAAKHIVNLPTRVSSDVRDRVVEAIQYTNAF